MINAIVGRPRSGKSYEAVRYHIIPAILKDKRLVVTNIPVNVEYISKIHGEEVAELVVVIDGRFSAYGEVRPFAHEKDFLQYDDWKNDKGQGPLFIVDEMHLSAGRNARPALLEYFSMHGHYGHDIICLTQNARKLNRDLKDMIEIVWRTTKMSAFGDDDSYLQKTHHGVDNLRDAVHTEERRYDPEWFPYYKSHTQTQKSVIEAVASDVKGAINPYSKWSKRLIVVGGIFACWSFYNMMFEGKTESLEEPGSHISVTVADDLPPPETELEAHLRKAPAGDPSVTAKTPDDNKTRNETELEKIKRRSKEYHPFNKVQLHMGGQYHDYGQGDSEVFFSASSNGQRLFSLGLKDLYLAGYEVQVLGDCLVKLTYYDYQEFITCDVPTMTVTTVASN